MFNLDAHIVGITESWCTPAVADEELMMSCFVVIEMWMSKQH